MLSSHQVQVVTIDVPNNVVVDVNPARIIKQIESLKNQNL